MLATEKDCLRAEIDKIAKKYDYDRCGLFPVLHHIQDMFQCISEFAIQETAHAFNIHPVEVEGVVTFYSFFSKEKKGKYIIRLCQTISCDMAGKEMLAKQLVNDLGIDFNETTQDGLFTLEYTNCIGMCDQGPALLVNDDVYTRVSPDKVHEILEVYRKKFGAHVTHAH